MGNAAPVPIPLHTGNPPGFTAQPGFAADKPRSRAYHPAREFQQHIFYQQAHELLQDAGVLSRQDRPVRLLVNPRDLSRLIGHRRRNLARLQEQLGKGMLRVIPSQDLAPDSISLNYKGDSEGITLTRPDFIRRLIERGILPQ